MYKNTLLSKQSNVLIIQYIEGYSVSGSIKGEFHKYRVYYPLKRVYNFLEFKNNHDLVIEPCIYKVVIVKLLVITQFIIELYKISQLESIPDATLSKLIKLFMRKTINISYI